MGYLGRLTKTGVLVTDNPVLVGGWGLVFEPEDIAIKVDCEIYKIALKGPANSQFEVYVGSTFFDQVPRGDVNSYDGVPPIHLRPGDTFALYFDTATAPAPTATVFFRETSPL